MSINLVCTLGPASQSREMISELIQHGMTFARINLSHGDHASHEQTIETVRDVSKSLDKKIQILADLQGPKIRLGEIKDKGVELKEGQPFSITTQNTVGDQEQASVDYSGIINDVKVGSPILINDGEVKLVVKSIGDHVLETQVLKGGTISSHKGVNLPGSKLNMPSLTEKDRNDLQFLAKIGVESIACSFIRQAVHIQEIKELLRQLSPTLIPRLIAKIETVEAVRNFSSIRQASDGIMIARGDLGVELPFFWIPVLQKAMIRECQLHHTFVITATQMLQSMVDHPIPTRAEVTDVFQAILDGTSAVMLSAESAAGQYPVESVDTLRVIAEFAERVSTNAPYEMEEVLALLASLEK